MLELFAGSCSIGKAARKLGCEVYSSDINDYSNRDRNAVIDYRVDIRDFDPSKLPFQPDIIWASPPCTGFSVASAWRHWKTINGQRVPVTFTSIEGIALVKKTIELIESIQPTFWFIENPRGMLRKQSFMEDFHRKTVTYCQYGDFRMKPTDIWTNCLEWEPRPLCKRGMPCHEASPRGTSGGVSGQSNAFERSKIPAELCQEILKTCIKSITIQSREAA